MNERRQALPSRVKLHLPRRCVVTFGREESLVAFEKGRKVRCVVKNSARLHCDLAHFVGWNIDHVIAEYPLALRLEDTAE